MGETTEKYTIDVKDAIKSLAYVTKAVIAHNKYLSKMASIAVKVAKTFVRSMQPVMKMARGLKRMAGGLKTAWNKATKGAWGFNNIYSAVQRVTGAITELASAMTETAMEGEKLQAVSNAFDKIGGTAKDMEALKNASAGLISDAELMRISNSANAFGIASEDLAKMLPIAVGAGQLLGESTEYMLSSIVTGTARQSKMIIDNLGIQLGSMSELQSAFAAKAGKSVESLTIEEKNHILVMELERKATKQLSVAESARGQKVGQTVTSLTNLTDKMKMMFTDTLKGSGALDVFSNVISNIGKTIEDNQDIIKQLAQVIIDLAIGFGELLADRVKSLIPILMQVVPLLHGALSVVTLMAPIFKMLAYIVGAVLNVALRVLMYAIKAVIVAMEALAVATGVGVETAKKAREQIDKGIKSLDMQAKKTKKAAKAQDKMAASTRAATQAMKAQASMDKIPKDLAEAYSQAAAEAEDMTEETARIKVARYHIDDAAQGARELKLVLGAVASTSGAMESQLLNAIERAGGDLETQISILARIEERALMRVDAMVEASGGAGGSGDAALQARVAGANVESGVNDIEDELYKRAAARDKGKQKADKKRVKEARKNSEDLADAQREARLMLMSEVDKERFEIEESYDDLITMLDGKNDGLVKGLVEGRTKALEDFEAGVSARQQEKRQEMYDEVAEGVQPFVSAWETALTAVDDKQQEWADNQEARAERTAQYWQQSAQAIGGAASSMFLDLVSSTDSFRDNIFKNLGQLFAQLGTAFMSWAVAEGNLLSGNPFGAIGASLALATVGGLISSIGSRKPSSGGSGGGASSAARRAFEDRKNREEVAPQTIILNYGFSAPDEVARASLQANKRGSDLRGARSDRMRGRAAA